MDSRNIALFLIATASFSSAAAQDSFDTRLDEASSSDAYTQHLFESRSNAVGALIKRGRYTDFVRVKNVISKNSKHSDRTSRHEENEANIANALYLAALGFSAEDVIAYRKRGIHLPDLVRNLFSGAGSFNEQVIVADTVVIAEAVEETTNRARSDGNLSALNFLIKEPLKGDLVKGQVVSIPQESGIDSDGMIVMTSSALKVKPGNTYLLVLSKNWYEHLVVRLGKTIELVHNAAPFLIYEVERKGNVALRSTPPSTNKQSPASLDDARKIVIESKL